MKFVENVVAHLRYELVSTRIFSIPKSNKWLRSWSHNKDQVHWRIINNTPSYKLMKNYEFLEYSDEIERIETIQVYILCGYDIVKCLNIGIVE